METRNYLPEQYRETNRLPINHNYLHDQFADHEEIWQKVRDVVVRGDFTLGEEVDRLEQEYAELCTAKHAIGVGSGTDALFLSLKAMGVDKGDEVITTPYTFYATIGAIVTSGARPVFADAGEDFNIDPLQIENKISERTKAIVPVHWSGKPCEMDIIEPLAKKYNLQVLSDACHAIMASYKGRNSGVLGDVAAYSFHPLKNLNVWGDGGIVTTNSDELAAKIRLIRNHGLVGRDECHQFAYNSRLDTIQAVVARHLLRKRIQNITDKRIEHAHYLDSRLRGIETISVPTREPDIRQVFHIYMVLAENRDELQAHLIKNGVDAKVHYPVPMHLQPAASAYGHRKGDFPRAEYIADHAISLPVHEFITQEQLDTMVRLIEEFYA